MQTKQKVKRKQPHSLIRRLYLLQRIKYQLDAYIVKKNKVRFNDTPIPHSIDRFIPDFDHRGFTGLYFKYTPYYGHFREVLFFTTLQAGPAKAVDFIKTLAERSEDKITFYRQVKFEFTFYLNERILTYKKDHIEHFANRLWGQKWPKLQAEFIAREILSWTEKYLLEQERSKEIPFEIESKIVSKPVPLPMVSDEVSAFSWKSYKGNKKDFLMFCMIPIYSGVIKEKPGFSRALYLEKMGQLFNIEIPDNPAANITSAIDNESYHEILNGALDFIKRYEKEFLIDEKKRGKNRPSGIKHEDF